MDLGILELLRVWSSQILPACYFFRLRRWVSVEAAADFAAGEAFELRNVLLAAFAAAAELSFAVLRCASAEPAADLAADEAVDERNVFDAFVATGLLVFSVFFLGMTFS
tara:strand:- start:76 stop:402 length:327 start_codon:yes stop_codon:yes gene_type:complete